MKLINSRISQKQYFQPVHDSREKEAESLPPQKIVLEKTIENHTICGVQTVTVKNQFFIEIILFLNLS